MAREKNKQVELRAVDDEDAPVRPVMRLQNRKTVRNRRDEKSARYGPLMDDEEPSRLEVPSRDELALRTHQPGVELLIDTEKVDTDFPELGWGAVSERRLPIPWGWFALFGLLIASAAVWSLIHMREANVQADEIRGKTQSMLAREEQEEREARELIDRIENSLRGFFKAATVETLASHVRHPERVTPLMRKYYTQHPVFISPLRTVRALQPLTLDDRASFWIASVELADEQTQNLVIEIDEAGKPLIDWETLVCDQPMPWDRFALERPADRSLDFRVYVEQDMFFSHEFSDSERWRCFRLTALDSEETLFGYLTADSAEARTLLSLLETNAGRKSSMILRLRIPDGLQSRRGVMIEKVISPRWIYLDSPVSQS